MQLLFASLAISIVSKILRFIRAICVLECLFAPECAYMCVCVCVSQSAQQSMGHFDNGKICCKICLAFKPKLGFVYCVGLPELKLLHFCHGFCRFLVCFCVLAFQLNN